MKRLFFIVLCLMSIIVSTSATNSISSLMISETDSSMIIPFYFNEQRDHVYRIANNQTIPNLENNQYSVSWYVDTEEWDWDPMTNHIYSKIEFKKGDKVFATFCDDEGWSYIAVENSKAKMFKSFKLDSDHTAVVFRGGAYAAGVPVITIFILCGDEVRLIFNREYFIEKIETDKILIKHEIDKPVCGHLSFSGGHISIVSDEFPNGKTIF